MPYPAAADLAAHILAFTGITVDDDSTLEPLVASAVTRLEKVTGYKPFIAADEPSQKVFNPPGGNTGGRFAIGGGFGRFLNLRSGIVDDDVTVSNPDGEIPSDQWHLGPPNALAEGRPYGHIEFTSYRSGTPRSITVTGRWGYCNDADMPGDVYLAILDAALGAFFQRRATMRGDQAVSWSEAGVSESYNPKALAETAAKFFEQADEVFGHYVNPHAYL